MLGKHTWDKVAGVLYSKAAPGPALVRSRDNL
jgi:hypothetical protein